MYSYILPNSAVKITLNVTKQLITYWAEMHNKLWPLMSQGNSQRQCQTFTTYITPRQCCWHWLTVVSSYSAGQQNELEIAQPPAMTKMNNYRQKKNAVRTTAWTDSTQNTNKSLRWCHLDKLTQTTLGQRTDINGRQCLHSLSRWMVRCRNKWRLGLIVDLNLSFILVCFVCVFCVFCILLLLHLNLCSFINCMRVRCYMLIKCDDDEDVKLMVTFGVDAQNLRPFHENGTCNFREITTNVTNERTNQPMNQQTHPITKPPSIVNYWHLVEY